MLTDLIPAKARKYVYAVLGILAFGVTVWQGADGDWKVALPALIVALSHALAAGNTDA